MRNDLRDRMLAVRRQTVDSCAKCNGDGYLPMSEPGVLNPCDCMLVLHYLNTLIEARIPQDYWWLTLNGLTAIDKKYRELCTKYVKHLKNAAAQARGVFFYGANGIGKTSLQCVIGKAAIIAGFTVQYFTSSQLIEALRNSDVNADRLAEFETAQFILLDEIDKVYVKQGSSYVPKLLEEFLRRVVSRGTAAVMCANSTAAGFENTFGESTTSMLKRHLKFVPMKGSDYSNTLHNGWMENLTRPRDYIADPILAEAKALWIREQEEETHEWEKAR